MFRMLGRQMHIERPSHHPPGPMPELLDRCEGGLARRTLSPKPRFDSNATSSENLLSLFRGQVQIYVQSVLTRGNFLSKGSNLPRYGPSQ